MTKIHFIKFNLFILVTFLIFSCDNSINRNDKYADSRKIYKEAIKIHDEVMPIMGEIMKLQKSLKSKKEKISDSQTVQEINESLQKLEDAHQSMMVWMRTLTPIPEYKESEVDQSIELPSPDEMLEIQKSSLQSVKIVKELILSSIEEGNKLLTSL